MATPAAHRHTTQPLPLRPLPVPHARQLLPGMAPTCIVDGEELLQALPCCPRQQGMSKPQTLEPTAYRIIDYRIGTTHRARDLGLPMWHYRPRKLPNWNLFTRIQQMLAKRKYMCLGGGQKRRRRGRSLGGQGVGIEKICESGRCEEQDTPPL